MLKSPLRMIKRVREFIHISDINQVPDKVRGIYVLYKSPAAKSDWPGTAEVVYVGLASTSIHHRLVSHRREKPMMWTHATALEVWDNISDEEIEELEGLFRHIYRKDSTANALNKLKSFPRLKNLEKIQLKGEKASEG